MAAATNNYNAVAADPLSPTVAYAGGGNVILKTVDGGQTWTASYLPHPGYPEPPRTTAIEIDPHNPRHLYAGAGIWDFTGGPEEGWLYRSDDAGVSWQVVSMTWPISPVSDIAFDPANSQVVYVSTGRRWMDSTDHGSGILKTTDGGATWAFVNTDLTARNITRVAVDSGDASRLYSGANRNDFYPDAGVYVSADAGGDWDLALGDMRVSGLEADPVFSDTVYAGSYWNGLWHSEDRGASWQRFDGALGWLSSLCVDVVRVHDHAVVYAGVAGGVYQAERAAGGDFYGSGVYRLVIDGQPDYRVFLPLVLRRE